MIHFKLHCNTIRRLAVPQIFSVLLLDIGGVLFLVKLTIAQKMKFFIKDFFRKCDQIRSFRRIRSHLLKKSLMWNFIFCAVNNTFWNTFLFLKTPSNFINPSTEEFFIWGTLIKFPVIYSNHISDINQNAKFKSLVHIIYYISWRKCCNSTNLDRKLNLIKKLRKFYKLDNKIMTEKSYVAFDFTDFWKFWVFRIFRRLNSSIRNSGFSNFARNIFS